MEIGVDEVEQHWPEIMRGAISHRKNVVAVKGPELLAARTRIAQKLKLAESEIVLVWRFKKSAANIYSCYLKSGPPMLVDIYGKSKPVMDQLEVAQCLPRIRELLANHGRERELETRAIITRCRIFELQMYLAELGDRAEWARLLDSYRELYAEALKKPVNKIFLACVIGVNYELQACLKLANYN